MSGGEGRGCGGKLDALEQQMLDELDAYWADCDTRGVCRYCDGSGETYRLQNHELVSVQCTYCRGTGRPTPSPLAGAAP